MIFTRDAMVLGWNVILLFLVIDIVFLVIHSVLRRRAAKAQVGRQFDVIEVLEKIDNVLTDTYSLHEEAAKDLAKIRDAVEKKD